MWLTFDTVHLLPTGPAEEVELTAYRPLHFEKAGQEQDDFHFVVGQVPSTADALGTLSVRPTQEDHRGPLVVIFWVQSGGIKAMTKQ